jgi:hypothetical protein
MNRRQLLCSACGLALTLGSAACAQDKPDKPTPAAPNFIGKASDWVNGPPQDMAKLKGKVVVVAVWTFQ